ncbi:DUF4136 domain-containing protein [Flagellimonas marinaquae]|uniref:DUF4136 domain-containing protein n=1 Tax=Flagellimonas aurea TaxID=2915619 RepID=A0ABS3G7E9_9FLAO|nr:DUF4136 domain-containing protein [Allomuricauda aurea]MAO16954.1 hypothetical protein [Allomuricauda sp.]MBO0355198.1 DUF4136 domain-containing protein [Allomuricauda aurea]UBZ15127.1 DUF4136 domain-containing protein [Allomuricauda aquimarina]|tara:strand:- start:464 stop:988 length:525 start_codon:yes stop_codon:yes gene_type:complete
MRYLLFIVLIVVMASCSSVKVNYDYDKTVDFSSYSTYNYYSDMQSGLSQLDEKRLLNALDSTLKARGYRLAEEPELFINIMSNEYRSAPNNNVGVGLGGGGRNVGGGISVGLPLGGPNMQRSIQIDLVDAQRDALVWQAVAESGLRENASPSVREDKLRAVVKKVFSKFPPKVK